MERDYSCNNNEYIKFPLAGIMGSYLYIGLITTLTEWKKIHCSGWKKIAYTFTFPLFMFTYITDFDRSAV